MQHRMQVKQPAAGSRHPLWIQSLLNLREPQAEHASQKSMPVLEVLAPAESLNRCSLPSMDQRFTWLRQQRLIQNRKGINGCSGGSEGSGSGKTEGQSKKRLK